MKTKTRPKAKKIQNGNVAVLPPFSHTILMHAHRENCEGQAGTGTCRCGVLDEIKTHAYLTYAGDDLPALALHIRKRAAQIEALVTQSAVFAVDTGHALRAAKAKLKHGEWQPWLKKSGSMTARPDSICS